MNKTSIEWTDMTWNPITGCTNNCQFDCYARRMSHRLKGRFGYDKINPFKPTWHGNKTNEPSKVKGKKIFTCSMGDFWDKEVPLEWRQGVMSVIWNNPKNVFQILTKQPWNIDWTNLPPNLWMGVSVTKPDDIEKIQTMVDKIGLTDNILFISVEPYLERLDHYEDFFRLILEELDWVIVGGLTGRKSFIPPKEWVDKIVSFCGDNRIPVFLKDNLKYPKVIHEFPTKQYKITDHD